jgi:D-alanyl-D-alanine carboxypeptidase/D-alanyl-D-alanine-endopeptidase (penicillin-binding protein 4)
VIVRMKRFIFLMISLIFFASTSKATVLDSFCHASADHSASFKGKDVNELLPIASVSKIFTSHWSLLTLGANYQFVTKVFLTPVNGQVWDLHLQGSKDPYFGKQTFHFLISELNKLGITKIRNFSFDENFKAFWNVTSNAVASGDYDLDAPNADFILKNLEGLKPFLRDYESTAQQAEQSGIKFFFNPQFQIETLAFQSANQFRPTAETLLRTIKSTQLKNLLKEMNRNSNNHAANQIFEKAGGREAFQKFEKSRLNLSEKEVLFVNGSGAPLVQNEVKLYNKATCASVLKTLLDLRKYLLTQNSDLQQILAVAGGDLDSTVNRRYLTPSTNLSLIGKTGTINPAITLGGMLSTKKGHVVFFYNMKTNGRSRDWGLARTQIKSYLTTLINSVYSGSEPLNYQVTTFNPFGSPLVVSASRDDFSPAQPVGGNMITSSINANEWRQMQLEDHVHGPQESLSEPELLLGSFE